MRYSPPYHDFWYNTILDKKYFYYKPLCYQPLENTENQRSWNKTIYGVVLNKIYQLIEIDKKDII